MLGRAVENVGNAVPDASYVQKFCLVLWYFTSYGFYSYFFEKNLIFSIQFRWIWRN